MDDTPAASFSGEAGASEAAVTGSGGLKNTGKGDPPMGEPLISTSSYGRSRRHHHTASVSGCWEHLVRSVDTQAMTAINMHVAVHTNLDSTRCNMHSYMVSPLDQLLSIYRHACNLLQESLRV